jgi:hypothetical protein
MAVSVGDGHRAGTLALLLEGGDDLAGLEVGTVGIAAIVAVAEEVVADQQDAAVAVFQRLSGKASFGPDRSVWPTVFQLFSVGQTLLSGLSG